MVSMLSDTFFRARRRHYIDPARGDGWRPSISTMRLLFLLTLLTAFVCRRLRAMRGGSKRSAGLGRHCQVKLTSSVSTCQMGCLVHLNRVNIGRNALRAAIVQSKRWHPVENASTCVYAPPGHENRLRCPGPKSVRKWTVKQRSHSHQSGLARALEYHRVPAKRGFQTVWTSNFLRSHWLKSAI
jgi:hypothetical protein